MLFALKIFTIFENLVSNTAIALEQLGLADFSACYRPKHAPICNCGHF